MPLIKGSLDVNIDLTPIENDIDNLQLLTTEHGITINTLISDISDISEDIEVLSVNEFVAPSIIKTVAASDDFFVGIDSNGELYKISKADLLAGLSIGGGGEEPEIPVSDPYANSILLWLKGDGTNNSIDIVDSSSSSRVITVHGNTKISTAQSKYGGSSIYFDGSGDFLSFPLDMGFQTFTVECFVYPTTQTPEIFYMANNNNAVINTYKGLSRFSGNWGISKWGSGQLVNYGATAFTLNAWNHVAVCRDGTNKVKCFVNGNQVGSDVTIAESFSSPRIVVGFNASSEFPSYFTGYIDSFRISNTSRYGSSFNPETDTYLN